MAVVTLGYPGGRPPNPKQAAFHAHPAQFRLLLGALGAGKTATMVVEDLIQAFQYPGSVGVVFRKTYPALRDTTKRQYSALVPPELIAKETRSEGREEIEFVNGSRTLFRCLDDPKKLGSTQFDRIVVDEGWEVDEESIRTLCFGRLRGTVGPRRLVIATNPPDEDHHLHSLFVEHATAEMAVFHLSTYDNAANLPPGYITNMETHYSAREKRKYLMGLWGFTALGKGVFEADFEEARHVVPLTPLRGATLYRGWDFGFRRPVCILFQLDTVPAGAPHAGASRANILREVWMRDVPLRQFAPEVLRASRELLGHTRGQDYCDVAGNQRTATASDRSPTAMQILANEFRLQPMARKMGLHQSIEAQRQLFRQGRVRINAATGACTWLIKGCLGGYQMDAKKDVPIKDGVYDNFNDAWRYALVPVMAGGESAYEGKPLPPSWRRAV